MAHDQNRAKRRLNRVGIGVAVLATVLTGLLSGGTAFAAAAVPAQGSQVACTPQGCLARTISPAPVLSPRGVLIVILPAGVRVEVTCWYRGNPPPPWHGDGYQYRVVVPVAGHIPGPYLNFGSPIPHNPPPGLRHC